MHGGEYRLPELPRFSVDDYCPETRTGYEFFGCYYHGHTWQPFRDITTLTGDMVAERYEQTMSPLEHVTRAGYLVKLQ